MAPLSDSAAGELGLADRPDARVVAAPARERGKNGRFESRLNWSSAAIIVRPGGRTSRVVIWEVPGTPGPTGWSAFVLVRVGSSWLARAVGRRRNGRPSIPPLTPGRRRRFGTR